ncbi:hypothetical protein LTR12_017398 [Friedmanniomyces endolithicus]|nr:hypothetical protein LTR74_003765 [Friedmanniomyces endolithicus]KAK1808239.1 hypothetical protein LTR12_017398 [Friedmanniomyces endolithicus]
MTDHRREGDYAACTKLVVVCCHAAYTGDGTDFLEEEQWLLQPFQRSDFPTRKPSETGTFLTHISTGALLCLSDSDDMLMFSGGHTLTSQRSEAGGYNRIFHALVQNKLVPAPAFPPIEEEHATDSYQNLLFSILRFQDLVGRYPEDIIVVTHAFKERRFLELHAPAIKWPPGRIRVQGVNPPCTLEELQQTQRMESERAYEPFPRDAYGVRSPLANKRKARNWDPAIAGSLAVDASMKQLLEWDGGESGRERFPGRLRWEEG